MVFNRKEYMEEYGKKRYQKNKDNPKFKLERKERFKKWYQKNPNYYKEYYQKNKKRELSRIKKWEEKNPEKRKGYIKKCNKKRTIRYENDKSYNTRVRLRANLRRALKFYTKTGKIYPSKYYGVDYKAIIEHLKPFPKDLKNYQIHHIKPLHPFNFVNKDGSINLKEVKKAFSPKNHKWVTKKEHKEIHRKMGRKE